MKYKEKIKFLENKIIKLLCDENNDVDGYFENICVNCKKHTATYSQKQTSETYCRDCLIYEAQI